MNLERMSEILYSNLYGKQDLFEHKATNFYMEYSFFSVKFISNLQIERVRDFYCYELMISPFKRKGKKINYCVNFNNGIDLNFPFELKNGSIFEYKLIEPPIKKIQKYMSEKTQLLNLSSFQPTNYDRFDIPCNEIKNISNVNPSQRGILYFLLLPIITMQYTFKESDGFIKNYTLSLIKEYSEDILYM